jgi:hypothetical protein
MLQIIQWLRKCEENALVDVDRKTAVEALTSLKWFHHQHGFTRDAELISLVDQTLSEQTGDRLLVPREICERLVEKVTKAHELRKASSDRAVLETLQDAMKQSSPPNGPRS